MKTLAIALALAVPAMADAKPRIYDVHATHAISPRESSCNAASRMLKDRYVMKIDDDAGTVTINGMKWKVTSLMDDTNLFTDLTLSFHDRAGQLVYLEMDIYVNMRGLSGKYTLHGVDYAGNPRREPCYDTVEIDGTAR